MLDKTSIGGIAREGRLAVIADDDLSAKAADRS